MAIPDDRKLISTNLPFSKLDVVLDAIQKKTVLWDVSKTSLVSEGSYGEFEFENAQYSLEEIFESVVSVDLKSAKNDYIQPLIDELEKELAVVVEIRQYDQAKEVNEKIESLKNLLT